MSDAATGQTLFSLQVSTITSTGTTMSGIEKRMWLGHLNKDLGPISRPEIPFALIWLV